MKKLLLFLALTGVAQAEAPRSVDVTSFDVVGIRLGMTPEQAKAAVKAKLGDDVAIVDEKFAGQDPVTGQKTPSNFSIKSGNHSVLVFHATNLLANKPNERAVYLIKYEMPYTQENVEAIKTAALDKYGVNSNAPNDLPMHWCQHPNENTGIGCDKLLEPSLKIAQNTIELHDPRYREAITRWMDSKKNDTPKL